LSQFNAAPLFYSLMS